MTMRPFRCWTEMTPERIIEHEWPTHAALMYAIGLGVAWGGKGTRAITVWVFDPKTSNTITMQVSVKSEDASIACDNPVGAWTMTAEAVSMPERAVIHTPQQTLFPPRRNKNV